MNKNNKNPFVTIGVIAKNEEEFIGETILNLLKIDYPKNKYEIIFVNDRSTDGTKKIVSGIKNNNENITIVDTKTHKYYGPCHARNCVIQKSNSLTKYIAYTDADCLVKKDWLKVLVDIMENNNSEKIVGAGGPRYVHKSDSQLAIIINKFLTNIGSGGSAAFSPKQVKYIDSIANYNAIYKKDILLKNNYDDRLILSDDNELNFRLRKKGFKFLYSTKAIIYHHETGSIYQFFKNMVRYGDNITRTIYKHKNIIRWYTVLMPIFLIGLIFGFFLSFLDFYLLLIYIFSLSLYFILIFSITISNVLKEKNFKYSIFILLIPLQHIGYGYGILKGLYKNRWVLKLK